MGTLLPPPIASYFSTISLSEGMNGGIHECAMGTVDAGARLMSVS